MAEFTLFSAAATWAWRKRRDFPICTARRSVGDGEVDFGVACAIGAVVDVEAGVEKASSSS